MAFTNAGPSSEVTINTVPVRSPLATIQTIGVTMTPTTLTASTTTTESFGANGATQVTAATGILPGDVVLAVNFSGAQTAAVGVGGAYVDPAVLDKFYVIFTNSGAGTPVPASGVYLVTVARFIQSASVTPATFSTLPSSITTN
jgi:hypothetical protein